jgi:DNA modification methylase
MCLRLHGTVGIKRVMDPFLGLGSTSIAAARLGIDSIGFEIDQAYLDVAQRQLETETGVNIEHVHED